MYVFRIASAIFLAIVIAVGAVAEDPVEIMLGFHSRNPDHPLQGLEAACIGIEGVRSPVGGGSDLITPTANTLLNAESMTTPRWDLRGDPALRVAIIDWFNPQNRPVEVRLYDVDGNIVATLSAAQWVWEMAEGESEVVSIEGTGQFSAEGDTDNKGTHVLLAVGGVSLKVEIPDNPMFRNAGTYYLDGQPADINLKVIPEILTEALDNTSIQLTSGGGWNPSESNQPITFERRGDHHEWRVPNSRWFRNGDDCNKNSRWEFQVSGTVNARVVTADGEHDVTLGYLYNDAGERFIDGHQLGGFFPGNAYATPSQRRIGVDQPWYVSVNYQPEVNVRTQGGPVVYCLPASQWYGLIESEELRHRRQFTNPDGWGRVVPGVLRETNRAIRQRMQGINQQLRRQSFATYQEAVAAGEAAALELRRFADEGVNRLNQQLDEDTSRLRCRIEAEAKGPHPWGVNMPAPFNLTCSYPGCPSDLREAGAFEFNLPSSIQ